MYIAGDLIKRAKKQSLSVDEQILKNSMIRSLYREAEKILKSNEPSIIESMQRQINYKENMYKEYYHKYWDLLRKVQGKYGTNWEKDNPIK